MTRIGPKKTRTKMMGMKTMMKMTMKMMMIMVKKMMTKIRT